MIRMHNELGFCTKDKVIKALRKTRLVVGNGFDLYCGLKTKYSDYFSYNSFKNNLIDEWIDKDQSQLFVKYISSPKDSEIRSRIQKAFAELDQVNAWDVAFTISSRLWLNENGKSWHEIESTMLMWLQKEEDEDGMRYLESFKVVYHALNQEEELYRLTDELAFLAALIFKKHEEKPFSSIESFYAFLLDELILFERDFGKYINHQQFDDSGKNFNIITFNADYERACNEALQKLCPKDGLIAIDTFNFGTMRPQCFENLLHHINGNTTNPIFGIDSKGISVSDPEYIFTKTYRRMGLDTQIETYDERGSFENVIVFGHSLCESDYSYFFPVLDQLRMLDFTATSKIIFAFSIYDEKHAEEIRSKLLKSVAKLFESYAESKHTNDSSRLLDSLTTQGRVLMYKIV